MPNRIIKESIRTSKTVNSLSDFEFRVWLYLITYVDDYGRGSADPEILRGMVFPRRKGITEAQISDALHRLANTGMVNLYEVDGEPYFYFPKWRDHQRVQQKHSKFPDPPLITVDNRDTPLEARSEKREAIDNAEAVDSLYNLEFGKVMSFYQDRFNAAPNGEVIGLLQDYTEALGSEVVLHVLQYCVNERKFSWSYAAAIFRRYKADGLDSMEKVLQAEQDYQARKRNAPDNNGRRKAKAPGEYKGEDFIDFMRRDGYLKDDDG